MSNRFAVCMIDKGNLSLDAWEKKKYFGICSMIFGPTKWLLKVCNKLYYFFEKMRKNFSILL